MELKTIDTSFEVQTTQLKDWETKAFALVVTDVSQKTEMAQAREARLIIAKVRTAADKIRKELKEDSLKFGNTVQATYNAIESKCKAIESHLLLQEEFEKRQIADNIESLRIKREEILMPYRNFLISSINLGTLPEDDFKVFFDVAKYQYEQAEKDAQKQKDDEIAAEKLRIETAAAAAKLAKEQAAENERLHAELKAQRDAAAKIESELRAQKDAELKAQRDAAAKLNAPLKQWVQSFVLPETAANNEKTATIKDRFEQFKLWAQKEIEN